MKKQAGDSLRSSCLFFHARFPPADRTKTRRAAGNGRKTYDTAFQGIASSPPFLSASVSSSARRRPCTFAA